MCERRNNLKHEYDIKIHCKAHLLTQILMQNDISYGSCYSGKRYHGQLTRRLFFNQHFISTITLLCSAIILFIIIISLHFLLDFSTIIYNFLII